MHLVLIIHDKFLGIASVSCGNSATGPSSWNDLALGSHRWYLVIVFLYGRQIYVSTRLSISFIIFIINGWRDLSVNQIALVGLGRVAHKLPAVVDLTDGLRLLGSWRLRRGVSSVLLNARVALLGEVRSARMLLGGRLSRVAPVPLLHSLNQFHLGQRWPEWRWELLNLCIPLCWNVYLIGVVCVQILSEVLLRGAERICPSLEFAGDYRWFVSRRCSILTRLGLVGVKVLVSRNDEFAFVRFSSLLVVLWAHQYPSLKVLFAILVLSKLSDLLFVTNTSCHFLHGITA